VVGALFLVLFLVLFFFFLVVVVGPALAAEQLPATSGAPLHVAAEVVEPARTDAAVVAPRRGIALRAGWPVGEALVTLACELDDSSAA
jgi:hypothetical protein